MKKLLLFIPALFLVGCAKKFDGLKKKVSGDWDKVNEVVISYSSDLEKSGLVAKGADFEDANFLYDNVNVLTQRLIEFVPKRVSRFDAQEKMLTAVTDVYCYPFVAYTDLLSHREATLSSVIQRGDKLQVTLKKRMYTYQNPVHSEDLEVVQRLDKDQSAVKAKAKLWQSILLEILHIVKSTKEYRQEKIDYNKEVQNQKLIESIDKTRWQLATQDLNRVNSDNYNKSLIFEKQKEADNSKFHTA